MDEGSLREAALEYHRAPAPGKISVTPTKGLTNQHDLALAYSPGVAYACLAIRDDPQEAATLTARSNLVAVITNGTAVLGLGNIGPLAGKPVMEGEGCLFKKFAGIDVFDIEIDASDPDKIVDIVAALEPTFGGINLEDIKAPECFIVERMLRERMRIPVFHDGQDHGRRSRWYLRSPIPNRKSGPNGRWRFVRMRSPARDGRAIPTRSTTSSAFRSSSGALSMWAPPPSMRKC
jgi:malate dehydrogenase (oxaloacetate-decarboxylating)(NADP+)